MKRVSVMHLIDTLNAGGAERMAVNIVNSLPRDRFVPQLCTTRSEGPLAAFVDADVQRLFLNRETRLDVSALRSLLRYIKLNEVNILHAHGTALFIASAAARFAPLSKVVWHDHWGRHEIEKRPAWLYRIAARRAHAVIAVNQKLAQWSREKLLIPSSQVHFIPNFVCDFDSHRQAPDLPGTPGSRIICVANFRPQKDLITLIRAMRLVCREFPAAHLLLVGSASDSAYHQSVQREVAEGDLTDNVTFMGARHDVVSLLRGCDLGVLSSASEGLPLSLIEYGLAGLPSIATRVGECAEVLDNGRAGILVAPGAADQLAQAIIGLLRSPDQRALFSKSILDHVKTNYDAASSMNQICRLYETLQPGR